MKDHSIAGLSSLYIFIVYVGSFILCKYKGLSGWKKGDIVAFTLDCNKWKFKIYLNDSKLKTVSIKENTVYYVAIGSVNNNSEYQILSFD